MLEARTTLLASGYFDRPVPNTLVLTCDNADHLLIVFPDPEYQCDGPLFRYPMLNLLFAKVDVFMIQYRVHNLEPDTLVDALIADARVACRVAVQRWHYSHITLISKSLGSIVMAELLQSEPHFSQADTVWLAPMLKSQSVCTQLKANTHRTLIAIGTMDANYDHEFLTACADQGVQILIVEKADNNLEILSDIPYSIHLLADINNTIIEFLNSSDK